MMKDIRQYIDKVLGSSIRCLLPSYWWKRIFGLIVDEVEDVRKVANSKANKSVVDDVKEVSLRVDEVSTKVDEMVSYILYAPITTLTDEQKAHNAEVFRTIGLKNKPYELEVYFVSGSTLYKVALNGFNRQSTQIEIICSHPLSPSPFGVQMKAVFVSDGSCTTEPLRPDAELNAGSLSAIQNKVVTNALATKQDKITDLDTIRANASKGATALQSVPSEYVTESELSAKGYATTSQVNEKQDKISDLETIRSGAAKGATSIQSVKTINGQSIIGEGDITIEGGSEITIDSELSETSENPVQNKVVTETLNDKADISYVDEQITNLTNEMIANEEVHSGAYNDLNTRLNELSENVHGETITKEEFNAAIEGVNNGISAKQDVLVSGTNIKSINGESILGSGDIKIGVDTSTLTTKEELQNLQNEVINNEEVTAAAINDLKSKIVDIYNKLNTLGA